MDPFNDFTEVDSAKGGEKPVLIYFYSTRAKYRARCEKFEKGILMNQDIVKYANDYFLCCKIDCTDFGKRDLKKYRVKSYPTVMFFSSVNGKKLYTVPKSKYKITSFSGILKAVLKKNCREVKKANK